jgi:DNA-binding transcriptional MerR regulator
MPQKIPSKLFFKIGEVCELTDTQPYVLRYWESEFPALAPAKNNSGQRIYRRRDIETILRIKTLLYEEGFTIAGAKKKLEQEMKEQLKAGGGSSSGAGTATATPVGGNGAAASESGNLKQELQSIRAELRGILELIDGHDSKRKRS